MEQPAEIVNRHNGNGDGNTGATKRNSTQRCETKENKYKELN